MKKLVINKQDLIYNIDILKKLCDDCMIIAVLKGNGYGLGICEFAGVLIDNGISFFAVSEISEAKALRDAGFTNDILLLTPAYTAEDAQIIADLGITATIGSLAHAEILNTVGAKIKAHIKIDTGFGRFGFDADNIDGIADKLKLYENIEYEGIYSHFSNSFGKKEKTSKQQYDLFMKAVENFGNSGIEPKYRHICNSCGALRYKYAHLDAVRIGSAFLGRLPIVNTYGLRRIAHLYSEIADIRTLQKGKNVGYANTYKTKRVTKIAVVPVGYKDGFGVEKSRDTFRYMDVLRYIVTDSLTWRKKNYVTVNEEKIPIIGRISMYNIVLDITDHDINIGDKVMLECNPILIESTIERDYNSEKFNKNDIDVL